jgi:hypothetical protein
MPLWQIFIEPKLSRDDDNSLIDLEDDCVLTHVHDIRFPLTHRYRLAPVVPRWHRFRILERATRDRYMVARTEMCVPPP